MIIMDTVGDAIRAEASAASSLTVTLYGIENASSVDSYKKLGQSQLTGSGTKDLIYTVPSSTESIVSMILVANINSAPVTLNLWHVPNAGSAADGNILIPDVTIAGNSILVWNKGDITISPLNNPNKGRQVALTDAATIATDASLGDIFTVTLGGNRTLGTPTNPQDWQKAIWIFTQDGTGSRTLTLSSGFEVGDLDVTLSTAAGAIDYLAAVYNPNDTKWHVVAFQIGY